MGKPSPTTENPAATYIRPNELMQRWQCSRTQVDRIAQRAGLTKMCLGTGRNGMVRYIREEVEMLEARSQVRLAA